MEKARSRIFEPNLPHFLWQEAVAYAVYPANKTATIIDGQTITPYEIFFGRKPNAAILQQFSAPCHVLDQSGRPGKLDPKTRPARFMGIAENEGNCY